MPSSKSVKPTIQLKMKQQSKKKVPIKSTSEKSVSETISFVIKGKLTPIKPTFVAKKIDVGKKLMKLDKKLKTPSDIPRKKNVKKIKTVQKTKNFNSKKITTETKVKRIPVVKSNPKTRLKVLMKASQSKSVKPKNIKVEKPKGNQPKTKKLPAKKSNTQMSDSLEGSKQKTDLKPCSEDLKKKKTIAKLLEQANKVLGQQPLKRRKSNSVTETKPKKEIKDKKKLSKQDDTPREQSNDMELRKDSKEPLIEKSIKTREFKEDSSESSEDHNLEEIRQFLKNQSTEKSGKGKAKRNCDTLKKKVGAKMKKKPGKIIRKKGKNSQVEDKMKKLKLFGFWNGPKRQRVASLNALAKVHCLYENEGRLSMLDNPESLKIKKELLDTSENENSGEQQSSPTPKRSLRSVPGLRGAGKYWDMHNASSSSSEEEDNHEVISKKVPKVKKEPTKKVTQETNQKQRKRKQTEIIMDLKDMVVRKRMASLNATAILAASYSQEKRSSKSPKSESTDNTDSSEDESIREEEEKKKCYEDDVKKEDKVIEVHAKPNKKVAVILNQDTDVTITGVYVNSTTRSTHHEGYCSIAGMQYRISATSHTQTAATAVATETLLQSSSSTTTENTNAETLTPTGKSYKPLDALSNMRPPSGGTHHGHQAMVPPQHVMAMSPSGVRHSCSSAFSAPHPSAYHHGGPGHHAAPIGGEPGYIHGELPPDPGYSPFIHKGYYQPAGPLITVPVGHGQPPLAKSAPLSEISPTTPSPISSHQPPPAPSSNGDSSDSEVIITSVTAGKDAPPPPQAHASYRYSQYPPSVPPSYSYPYSSHYYHPNPPPPSYPPHDVCYSPGPYLHHKFPPAAYRRYLGGPQYYAPNPPPTTQDLYAVPPTHAQPSQQVVTTTPVSGSGSPYQPSVVPPPPSTLLEPYPPTIVETYPTHYYSGYPPGPPSACYSHAPPPRAVPFINGPYQSSCPCPMRSCPKNGLTGPLTGDSKRSNTLPKGNMPPLPPVALALPKEPTSDGPPSPARGSAGMPPPPSPAGATYQQQPTPPTKQESVTPPNEIPTEKKRKARVGKAMVRSNMQNTMLLMCNPIPPNCVKREIESPKEKDVVNVPEKDHDGDDDAVALTNENKISSDFENLVPQPVVEDIVAPPKSPVTPAPPPVKIEEKPVECFKVEPILEPIISTVGENVKVKNMKRKLSLSVETKEENPASPPKKQESEAKVNGSYKNLIKKNTSTIRINNGKRKLIQESRIPRKILHRETILGRRKAQKKRQLCSSKDSADVRRTKHMMKTKAALSKNKNSKDNCKNIEENNEELTESKENIKCNQKLAPAMLDNLLARNSVTMTCVISDTIRTNSPKKVDKVKQVKEPLVPTTVSAKKSTKKTYNTKNKKTRNLRNKISALVPRKSLQSLRWSNGWSWKGEPYEAKVFLNSDETTVIRRCYPSMIHHSGDLIEVRDCVLLKAGARRNELPFVAKIAALWENPDDGEMMMSLLWYYRPEHTDQGRLPTDQPDEVFASRHKDSNSVACIDDKCFVLTYNEYCRYRKHLRRVEEGIEEQISPRIPVPEPYPRSHRQPPHEVKISPEMVFFCRRVYDFRQKRIVKNPT